LAEFTVCEGCGLDLTLSQDVFKCLRLVSALRKSLKVSVLYLKAFVAGSDMCGRQKSMERKLEVGSGGHLFGSG